MQIDVTTIIITLIQLVLAPVIILGVKELINYLKAKAKNEKIQHYLDLAGDAVITAVQATKQTYVDAIKGTPGWDAAAQQKAFNMAMEKAMQVIGDEGLAILDDALADLNEWLLNKIEAGVMETKDTAILGMEKLCEP